MHILINGFSAFFFFFLFFVRRLGGAGEEVRGVEAGGRSVGPGN